MERKRKTNNQANTQSIMEDRYDDGTSHIAGRDLLRTVQVIYWSLGEGKQQQQPQEGSKKHEANAPPAPPCAAIPISSMVVRVSWKRTPTTAATTTT